MLNIKKRNIFVLELLAVIALYWLITWVLIPTIFVSKISFYLSLFLLVGAAFYYLYISPTFIYKDSAKSRGLGDWRTFFIRTDNFLEFGKLIWFIFLISVVIIIFAAWYKHSSFFIEPDWYTITLKLFFYFFSALLQDIFFFSFLLIRLREFIIVESDSLKHFLVVFIFAIFFAIFHLPNFPLIILSFGFSFYLGYYFYKIQNLHVIIIVHAILGTLLHSVYELHIKIGIFYGMPRQEGHLIRFLFPIINDIVGARW